MKPRILVPLLLLTAIFGCEGSGSELEKSKAKLKETKSCPSCELSEADLNGANLVGADLNAAKLNDANLSSAKLNKANLSGAFLDSANLTNANLTDANLSGVDLTASYQFSHHLSFRTKYAMVRARSRQNGDYLPFITPERLENTFRYHSHHWLGLHDIYVSVTNVYTGKQWRVLPESDYAPSPDAYMLLNAEAGLSIPALQDLTIGLTVHNLLNTRYRDYLNRFRYYTDETGRNVSLRIKYTF